MIIVKSLLIRAFNTAANAAVSGEALENDERELRPRRMALYRSSYLKSPSRFFQAHFPAFPFPSPSNENV